MALRMMNDYFQRPIANQAIVGVQSMPYVFCKFTVKVDAVLLAIIAVLCDGMLVPDDVTITKKPLFTNDIGSVTVALPIAFAAKVTLRAVKPHTIKVPSGILQ